MEKLAPHIEEIARALGDKLSEEQIAEELQKYVDVYRLSIPMAKRTIVKKYGGDMTGFSPGFQRKLAELRPNEPNVDFVAKVLSANAKEVQAKGEKKQIIFGFLGDDTTTLPYTAWEVEDLELSKGDVISVKGAYTREYQGRVQINFGNRVSIKKEDQSTIGDIQIAQGPPKVVGIGELREAMGYVEVKGRILSLEPREVTVQGEAKKIFSGVLADETGKVQFTAWSDFKLKQGEVVKISKGTVKAWRGIPQLSFDDRAEVIRVMEKFPSVEELQKTGVQMIAEVAARGGAVDATIRGVLIEIREGSGLIMRCPECKRALQKGICKLHGRVEGYPDLRVKAILDDGSGAVGVVMSRELTEKLLDITLDESMQKAKEKMNFDIVKDEMDEVLTLKVVTVSGPITADQYGLSMIAKEAQLSTQDVKQEAEKLLVELEGTE
ncbi:MAG: OB-fold nucleic acid binding domain-containing protein [Thermoplasmata archaeon]